MSWDYFYKPYVSAAERRRKAEKAAKALAKKGQNLEPIAIEGSAIAKTFWGKAWCHNLEAYSDYANRLPRGRTYVRNGSVIDLKIAPGEVKALVQGSQLYKITITIAPLPAKRWKTFKASAAGKVTNLLDLLQGKLSKDILAEVTAKGSGLFPSPAEIKLKCSCPDWADMCKHVAAALYGVGARLDDRPELFFVLRGVDAQELISAASVTATTPLAGLGEGATLKGEDLSALFGVEIEEGASAQQKEVRKPKKKARRKER
jgi:uncharacterized Zn finger protein